MTEDEQELALVEEARRIRRDTDWHRYPKLAAIFKNRPPENIYWIELVQFIEDTHVAPQTVNVSFQDLDVHAVVVEGTSLIAHGEGVLSDGRVLLQGDVLEMRGGVLLINGKTR